MNQKRTFEIIFLMFAILMVALPPLITFNDVLTKLVERFSLYMLLQEKIVPIQAQLVGIVVRIFGVDYTPFKDGMIVNGVPLKITWNCLGWQSLVLFFLSLFFGLKNASYTFFSKAMTVLFGIVGIFWINLLRIIFTIVLAVYASPIFRIVFHDYLAAVVTVLWLVFFWWFSYSFLLDEKVSKEATL